MLYPDESTIIRLDWVDRGVDAMNDTTPNAIAGVPSACVPLLCGVFAGESADCPAPRMQFQLWRQKWSHLSGVDHGRLRLNKNKSTWSPTMRTII